VNISIPFADKAIARAIEPGAPTPKMRFATIEALSAAGIDVGVAVAPVIPGLNEEQIVEILERAKDAGAQTAFRSLVRLAPAVAEVFEQRVTEALPLRAGRVIRAIERTRAGRWRFGERFSGTGPEWAAIDALFRLTARRLGLHAYADVDDLGGIQHAQTTFRRPRAQLDLFGGVA
jgi:DNA repair photolyase